MAASPWTSCKGRLTTEEREVRIHEVLLLPRGEIEMRITSKGQVTIPIEIRESAGLLPHTEVRFEVEGGIVKILREDASSGARGQKLIDRMKGRATAGMSTEEILSLTRGES